MNADFRAELVRRTAEILAQSGAENHLRRFPWLTGALGDPEAPVWFVAENPSLTMVERATSPGGGQPTEEAQWYASRGDKLFRDLLHKYGFKSTPPDNFGGWDCYITNVIKEPDYAQRWRGKPQARRDDAADRWLPVLRWEMSKGAPRVVVALGRTVEKSLRRLTKAGLQLPHFATIAHYSYVAHRPEGKLGPMHPDRIARYDAQFAQIARLRDSAA